VIHFAHSYLPNVGAVSVKSLDIKSLVVGGVTGAVLLALLINWLDTSNTNKNNMTFYAVLGFCLGAGVQVIERYSGAS
jgi:ABC-type Mn2+/Zn2+ transport system permease subunit